MIDNYNIYRLSVTENIRYILQGSLIVIILGGLFYESLKGMLCLCPIVYFYRKGMKRQLIKKRKWELNLEFRDGIVSLSAALAAGYSVEYAFDETRKDLSNIYEENSLIIQEFCYLNNQIRMNITVGNALRDLGKRSGVEDIISFAEVFVIAKRTGGDLVKVIKTTCNTISDKVEVKREIITLVTAKKFEANIMKVLPIGMLCYLKLSSPGYLDPLYHNLFGVVVMTFLLGVYLAAYLLINKIVDIEI